MEFEAAGLEKVQKWKVKLNSEEWGKKEIHYREEEHVF